MVFGAAVRAEPNPCGYKSVRCVGCHQLVNEKWQPYVLYSLEVRAEKSAEKEDGTGPRAHRWQIARRYAEFAELRQSLTTDDEVEETLRNTISVLPFPDPVDASILSQVESTGKVVNERAEKLHNWMRGVVKWAPRVSPLVHFLHECLVLAIRETEIAAAAPLTHRSALFKYVPHLLPHARDRQIRGRSCGQQKFIFSERLNSCEPSPKTNLSYHFT